MTDALSIDPRTLSDLIGDIYDCALEKERWVPTLQRLAGIFHASNGTILSHGVTSVSFVYHWGTPAHALKAYAETYAAIDPMLTLGWHFDIDDPVTAERFMTPDDLRKSRFYREFLAPLNWFDFIAISLEKSSTRTTTVGFTRSEEQGPPNESDKALIHLLAPHSRRAVIFHGIMEQDATRATDLAAAFDLIQMPMLLFNADGLCVDTNAAAGRFLSESDTIRLDKGMLRGRDRALTASIESALAHGAANPATPLSFGLTQADGRQFVAHVMPIAGDMRARFGVGGRAVAAMFMQEVGTLKPLPGEVLVKLYALTPAETRLIGLLARDRTIEEAAADLGIARTTARTHLQHIFTKTGTSRQSQLMRLVLSALPGPPG